MKLIIIGSGETALLAYEYFTYDSSYEVVAFCVERNFIDSPTFKGLPVIPLEDLSVLYPPQEHQVFIAVSYTKLNRLRTRLYLHCKELGYQAASYISSKAFVWNNVTIGENCFILENNVLQFSVCIGNNVTLWSGNHVGHQTIIQDNVFISSHVVISGYCNIGEWCFFGVNSAVGNNITVASDCVVGAGAILLTSTEEAGIYQGNPARRRKGVSSHVLFK
jgi:sugar O-acyltransferase (sialic acid O-acetyltransferase NeuD family)